MFFFSVYDGKERKNLLFLICIEQCLYYTCSFTDNRLVESKGTKSSLWRRTMKSFSEKVMEPIPWIRARDNHQPA